MNNHNWKIFQKACENKDVTLINKILIEFNIKSIPFWVLNQKLSDRVVYILAKYIAKKKNYKKLVKLYIKKWYDRPKYKDEHTYLLRALICNKVGIVNVYYCKNKFEDMDIIDDEDDVGDVCRYLCENDAVNNIKFLRNKKIICNDDVVIHDAIFHGSVKIIEFYKNIQYDFGDLIDEVQWIFHTRENRNYILRFVLERSEDVEVDDFINDHMDGGIIFEDDEKTKELLTILFEEYQFDIRSFEFLLEDAIYHQNKFVIEYFKEHGITKDRGFVEGIGWVDFFSSS